MKRVLSWVFSLVTLSLFTVYMAAGALGVGASTAYADTITSHNMEAKSHDFVVVQNDGKNGDDEKDGPKNKIGSMIESGEQICSLTPVQVAELDAFFNVKQFDVNIHGSSVSIAEVKGKNLTKQQLLQFLRATDQTLDCQVVGLRHLFFLPIVPQIS